MHNDKPQLTLKQIIIFLLITFSLALLITFAFVLPAKFGKDMFGIGERLGIKNMSVNNSAVSINVDGPRNVEQVKPHVSHKRPLEFMQEEIMLEAYGQVEYKFDMHQGSEINYSWSVSSGLAYADLHGHTPGLNGETDDETLIRYLEVDESQGVSGVFITPFAGEHGWYFLNLEQKPITIKLQASGYWDHRELIPIASKY